MRNMLVVAVLLMGCGNDKVPGGNEIDAPAGDVDAPDPTADAPALTLDCQSYCGAIQTACTGALAQYDTVADCLGTCAQFAAGTLGETTGNTLGCRLSHTDTARTDPTTECVLAGPGGGGTCGASACDGFCAVAPTVCPTQWSANNCAVQCNQLSSVPPFAVGATGDTLECRLYHLTRATTDATTHCPHVDRMNSATCQ